jgi:ribosomal biogenesis protein LAS1
MLHVHERQNECGVQLWMWIANDIGKVEAWKLRGNVPHHVEATALLTDAILHDDAQRNSIFSIRATYSAAFCR